MTLQDVHIRQLDGGFHVAKRTITFNSTNGEVETQRVDESVAHDAEAAIDVAATFLGVPL